MPVPSTSEFAAVCREAPPETVAGFVAALYEARGRVVTRVDDRTLVVSGDAGTERVAVPDDRRPAVEADRVVTAGRPDARPPDDCDPLDAAELRDALLYAVDRDGADDLLAAWFDRPLSSFGGPSRARTPADGETGETPRSAPSPELDSVAESGAADSARGDDRPTRRLETAAVAAVTAVVVAATVGLAFGVPAELRAGDADPADDVATPLARETLTATSTAAGGAEPTDGDGDGDGERASAADEAPTGRNRTATYPDGVDEGGIVDYRTLVETTRRLLADRSYTVTVTHREFDDGTETALFSQTVAVENATVYRSRTTRFGEFASSPPSLTGDAVYANGSAVVRPTGSDVARGGSLDDRDRVLAALSRYLGYYLSVSESTVAGVRTDRGTTTVRLNSRGDPWPGVANATGSAVVSEDGLVRSVRRAYDDPASGRRVVVTVRLSEVGRTDASAPSWAGNASRVGRPPSTP